jgi:ABC-type Co2+ transport system permease subunit
VVCLEAFVVLLVPRAIAQTSTGLGGVKTGLLIGFAVVLVAAGVTLRRSWGIGVGSLLQVPFVLVGVWIPAFFIVGALFVGVWLYLLNLRHELVGTPGGVRMLVS